MAVQDAPPLRLAYAFTPTPNVIRVSSSSANPSTNDLEVIVSNSTSGPITVQRITIDIPTGENISGDLSSAPALPGPEYDTSISWRITSAGQTITLAPKTGTSGAITDPIVFKLRGIQVNETIGTVRITVTEYAPPAPKVSDDQTYSLLKRPADFPVSSFSVKPDVLTDLDQYLTINWTCTPQGAVDAYGLRAEISVSGTSPTGTPTSAAPTVTPSAVPTALRECVSDGNCYQCSDGATGVRYGPVNQTTTFALDVVRTTPNGDRVVEDTLRATVKVLMPSISGNSFSKQSPTGLFVSLHWLATNAGRCSVLVDGVSIDDNAPSDTYQRGYLIVLTGSQPSHDLMVVAHATSGDAQAVFPFPSARMSPPVTIPVAEQPRTIAVSPKGWIALVGHETGSSLTAIDVGTWQVEPNTIQNVGTMVRGIAFSPDGNHAYVAAATGTVTVVDIPTRMADPNQIQVMYPSDIAITPDGSTLLVASIHDDPGPTSSVEVIDVATRSVKASIPVSTSGYPVRAVAISADGTIAVTANSHASDEQGSMTVIDVPSRQVKAQAIPVDARPMHVAITLDGLFSVASNPDTSTAQYVDLASQQATWHILTVDDPGPVAITPDGSYVAVGSVSGHGLSLFKGWDGPFFTALCDADIGDIAFVPGSPAVMISDFKNNRVLVM